MSTATRLTGTRTTTRRLTDSASLCPILPSTLPSDLPDGERERIARRNEAIAGNLRIAFRNARQFGPMTFLDDDDQDGEALLSFVVAADKHDPSRGALSTISVLRSRCWFSNIRDNAMRRARLHARYLEAIPHAHDAPAATVAGDNDERAWIREHVKSLPRKERQTIELRFGLNGGEPMTQKEIGKIFGVSRTWIQHYEKQAMEKLRAAMGANGEAARGATA